jgi:hypothetical protein
MATSEPHERFRHGRIASCEMRGRIAYVGRPLVGAATALR